MEDDARRKEAYENVIFEMEEAGPSRKSDPANPNAPSATPVGRARSASNGCLYLVVIGTVALLCTALCAIVIMSLHRSDQLSFQLYKETSALGDEIRELKTENEKLKLQMEKESPQAADANAAEIAKLKSLVSDLNTASAEHMKKRLELAGKVQELQQNMNQVSSEQAGQITDLTTSQKNADSKIQQMQKNRTDDFMSQEGKIAALTSKLDTTVQKVGEIENNTKGLQKLGSSTSPASSCDEIKMGDTSAVNGLYYLMDLQGNVFRTFCDMSTAGGGWTLVASVHENNMKGRCTSGDRWSSEQGFGDTHPNGDGFWENFATHGKASSATSDDYKNSGYFGMKARNIMIWQVPNDTPMQNYSSAAFLKYHTDNNFLTNYGGNLRNFYADHYPLRANQYITGDDNGPVVPAIWDVGNNDELMAMYQTEIKEEVDPGYIQFRAINWEQGAFALCPGVKIKEGKGNIEHVCIGSTSDARNTAVHCGDYAARDWEAEAAWTLDIKMINSVVMIFYK